MNPTDNNPLERMRTDALESEQCERTESTSEAGADGFAKGVTFTIMVDDPWIQLAMVQSSWEQSDPFRTFEFTDDEKGLYVKWLQARYPKLDFNFDADDQSEGSVYGEYEEGETTTELYFRVIKDTDYVKLLNDGTVFYHLAVDFMQHCMDIRKGIIPNPQEVN